MCCAVAHEVMRQGSSLAGQCTLSSSSLPMSCSGADSGGHPSLPSRTISPSLNRLLKWCLRLQWLRRRRCLRKSLRVSVEGSVCLMNTTIMGMKQFCCSFVCCVHCRACYECFSHCCNPTACYLTWLAEMEKAKQGQK
jgi:hypothetical protein